MTFTLIDSSGVPYESEQPGTLGGHRGNRVYGRLDCGGAQRWIERGHYVAQRVFFADEATAIAAGYRPCANCMPREYAAWKQSRADRVFSIHHSPVGPLTLSGDADAVTGLAFGESVADGWSRDDERFARERSELDEYFAGERTEFGFALRLEGSPFQRRVWEALRAIPYGTTTTYGELAEAIGSVGGARKVGSANARNPIAIAVPCHRVIGANGKLVGYGGGLDTKRDLLALEGALLAV
jgi:methylated-DNA-[protein]-cysteine S-methyltransferase